MKTPCYIGNKVGCQEHVKRVLDTRVGLGHTNALETNVMHQMKSSDELKTMPRSQGTSTEVDTFLCLLH
jgi:hypothetical protein